MLQAIRKGNLSQVKSLINKHGLHSKAWLGGYNLLIEALQNRHAEVAKLLLEHGSQVNTNNRQPTDTPLHFAAIAGDVDVVKMILSRRAKIDAVNQEGVTPLYNAVDHNNVEVTILLLKHGAKASVVDYYNQSLLHIAVQRECYLIVQVLLTKVETNVNAQDEYGRVPLHFAMLNACSQAVLEKMNLSASICIDQEGSREIVSLLLKNGANVNHKSDWTTPLQIAIEKSCVDIVEELLSYGASTETNFESREYLGLTPLQVASQKGSKEIVDLLLRNGSNVNAASKANLTPLYIAAQRGHRKIVKLFLKHGATIDEKNPDLLIAAVKYGYLRIIEFFLQRGASANMFHKGMSLLHSAAMYDREKVVELLLEYKADVNALDKTGESPLFYAVRIGSWRIAESLLAGGADLKINPTILNTAVKTSSAEIIQLLLSHKADVNTRDRSGKTPLQLVVFSISDEFFHKDSQHSFIGPDHINSDHSKANIIKLLLSGGADADLPFDESGKTVLHCASWKGFLKIVKILIEFNANVNAQTTNGFTALHYAIQNDHKEIVEILLKSGADLYRTLVLDQNTPLHLAAIGSYRDIVENILNYDVNIDLKNKDGMTALHLASQCGNLDAVETLLKYGSDINILDKNGNTPLLPLVQSLDNYYRNVLNIGSSNSKGSMNRNNNTPNPLQEVAKFIQSHIIKMEVAGLFVSKQYMALNRFSDYNYYLQGILPSGDFRTKCQQEISCMMNEKMGKTRVSFYDVLVKDVDHVASIFLENEEVVRVYYSKIYKAKYPLYANMIEYKCKRALKRSEILKGSSKFFHLINNDQDELPNKLVKKICSHLSDIDLNILADIFKLSSKCKSKTNVCDTIISSKMSQMNLTSTEKPQE
ncbi:hypothetical protein QAD02_008787 [Eretmocerus hayati]|uniref:Uncharacterized protein n=1 Tax=Eretmocerus hayati TaxID=131215 RepID=A0ACC2NBW3_9HYME|nr:hypothetical protein QAD02_008787 [Eretmocerus hayati]